MSPSQQLKNSEFHLKPAEIKKVIYSPTLTFRDRCILKTLALTAMRRAELAALDIRDVDLGKCLIHIRDGKGGKSRIVPVTDDLASDLKHLFQHRKTGPVFLSQRGSYLTPRQINWIVARAGKLAGVEHPNPNYDHLTCHLFRHSFAREWKKRGGSIESLSKILGHTSVKTTLDVYGTETLQDVQENYKQLVKDLL